MGNVICAKKTANFKPVGPTGPSSKAEKECIDGAPIVQSKPWVQRYGLSEEESWEPGTSVEAFRQLELSFERTGSTEEHQKSSRKELCVTSSGIPARVKRFNAKKKSKGKNSMNGSDERHHGVIVSPELLQNHVSGV